ncbi:MAG: DUF2206 domain-containing protein, partial [Methanotrichaceae archaeon]|nr:DUF2206 domain-containing protein [Methanotrichaceae archaeon]
MDTAILFNISFLREITAFVFLSFVPGFILLSIMKLKEIHIVDTILFSVGLSIAFLMFAGLLFNQFILFGVPRPLSTIPITIFLSLATFILIMVHYTQGSSDDATSSHIHWEETRGIISRSIMLLILPFLAFAGALFLNIPILLTLMIVISVLYILSLTSSNLIPYKLYPLMIFTISFALLIHVVFTSNYIIGFDSNLEYYVYKLTQINDQWSLFNTYNNPLLTPTANYNSMLSITILPTIYSSMLSCSGETVFKVLYPFLFSLLPVILFRIYETQVSRLTSLASVFFFISGLLVFYGVSPISLDRQIVAEFFFSLSVLIILSKNIPINKRRLLLIVFGAALVVSHYSLAYIYLVFISFIYVVSKIKRHTNVVPNIVIVISLFAITFSWYSISISPLSSLKEFLYTFISKFISDIFNPSARINAPLVSTSSSNIINSISLGIFIAAQFLIALGILIIICKPERIGLDPAYRTITILSASILFLSLVLPNFARSLNLDRFYAVSLLFLAPCFVLGFNFAFNLSRNMLSRATSHHVSVGRHSVA